MIDPRILRRDCRNEQLTSPTGTLAPNYTQANLALIPAELAEEFNCFLAANPGPFPLIAKGQPGDFRLPSLGDEIDIRTDLPRYRVFHNGQNVEDPLNIMDHWRDDLVPFAIGCTLNFEPALVSAGVLLRCYERGTTCSAFDSNLPLVGIGPFGGNLVVSMRAVQKSDLSVVTEITRALPLAHGPPVHFGDPAKIGVDLRCPIDGIGLTDIHAGELSVFWACGVSLERAISFANPDLAITHAPGHMLITDLPADFR